MNLFRRLQTVLRRDPLLTASFALLWICALVPLWVPRFLPLLDLPNHIDAIAIWHRYYDPSWGYSKFYNLNLKPVPYWGYFFPVHLMSYVLPIEVANKVYLSMYALALPVGGAVLAERMGRSPWLALFTFPLIFNMNFMFGFITCCAGMAVLPFVLYALDLFLEQPSQHRGVALCAAAMLLYFTHVLPWMFFGVAAVPLLFCHGWHPRRMLVAAALLLPSLFMALYGFRSSSDGSTPVKTGALDFEAKWDKFLPLLQEFPRRIITTWGTDDKAFGFLVILGLCWLLIALNTPPPAEEKPRPGFRYRLELLFLLAMLAALKLPAYQKKPVDLWMVGGRFVSMVAFFGALLPRGAIVGRRRLLMLPVIGLCIWYPLKLCEHWRHFDSRAMSMYRLMQKVPRGSSTLTLVVGDYADPDGDPQAVSYTQFHSYAQFFGGGFNPWALQTGFPMVQKKDKKLPAPTWKAARTFQFDEHGIYYDYILTLGEPSNFSLFGADDASRAPLVAHDGNWRLYEIHKP